jgi:lipoyl(octanoyl) transferase
MPKAPENLQNWTVGYEDWGRIAYKRAWDAQKARLQAIVQRKVTNRELPPAARRLTPNYLCFCEHEPVYTLGKSGDLNNLLLTPAELQEAGIEYYHIERGGDITYHGPGQITGYPIWDMENFGADLGAYLRGLEEAMIQVLAGYGLQGERLDGLTGVWLEGHTSRARKICAIGIKCSRWVTMHGFAFNVNTHLPHFDNIVPCGIDDKAVTSLAAELGAPVDYERVKTEVRQALADQFGYSYAAQPALPRAEEQAAD